jgi:hypothetical protein
VLAGGACAATVSTPLYAEPQKTAKPTVIVNATTRATHANRPLVEEYVIKVTPN